MAKTAKSTAKKEKEAAFSLEAALKQLRTIVDEMQGHELDFDRNVSLFKEGTTLIQQSRDYLDQSELLLESLLESDAGSSPDA